MIDDAARQAAEDALTQAERDRLEQIRVQRDCQNANPNFPIFDLDFIPEIHANAYDFRCCVCWNDFTRDQTVALTQCKHIMCFGCFQTEYNKVPSQCPKCRGAFP